MIWIELGFLVLLIAGGVIMGRALGGTRKSAAQEMKAAETKALEQMVVRLEADVRGMRARLETLERLATDEELRLAREIERLKRHRDGNGASPQA